MSTCVHFSIDVSNEMCFTDLSNRAERYCSGCYGPPGANDCHDDVRWYSDNSKMGTTICGLFDALSLESSKEYVYLESGLRAVSVTSAGRAKCVICMCETGEFGSASEN